MQRRARASKVPQTTNEGCRFRVASLLLPILLLTACTKAPPSESTTLLPRPTTSASIRVDGRFDDWTGIPNAIDDRNDAPQAELDLGTIAVQPDADFIHIRIDFNRERNLQRLDGTLQMLIDADGDSSTGKALHDLAGTDLLIAFSPEDPENPGRPRMGVGIQSTTSTNHIGHADIGFTLAPTHAASQVECRLFRRVRLPGTGPLFQAGFFRLKLVLVDGQNRVRDETKTLAQSLPSLVPSDAAASTRAAAIPPKPTGAIRLVTWNAEQGNLLRNPEPFARILNVLAPDVLLLQELTSNDSAAGLESFLNGKLSPSTNRWRAVFGEGGGRLRCAVASRLPIEPVLSMTQVPYTDRPDRQVRLAAGTVTPGPGKVLVVSAHLKCCGRIDSDEDKTRLEEVNSIHRAVKAELASGRHSAVLIGGDLNLVGGARPLHVLKNGLDLDGRDLDVIEPYQLDGRENATWTDPRTAFVAGRLDYLLVSGSVIKEEQSFILDTSDLAEEALSRHGLKAADSATASDHRPVVADLIITGH